MYSQANIPADKRNTHRYFLCTATAPDEIWNLISQIRELFVNNKLKGQTETKPKKESKGKAKGGSGKTQMTLFGNAVEEAKVIFLLWNFSFF